MITGSSPGSGSSHVCIWVKGCQTCALSRAARRWWRASASSGTVGMSPMRAFYRTCAMLSTMLLALTLMLAAPAPDRIVHAAKVWGEVRYFHPWLYTREVDWDAAFIRALPAILGEGSERAALQGMLDELHDPATR